MKKFFPLLVLVVLAGCRKDPVADPSSLPFARFYGTSGDETARQVRTLADGSIIVCGYGDGPNGGTDLFLLKTDGAGNQQWMKHYGGTGNEICWSFAQAADGGFVLGGYTNSAGAGGDDFFVVKTDAAGSQQWSKTYGGAYNDLATHIRAVNGGFLICGIKNSGNDENAWLIRLDDSGDSLWSYTWGSPGADGAMYSCAGGNGAHVITGYTNAVSASGTDGFLMIVSDAGTALAQYNFGTPGYDEPHSVAPAIGGNGWVISGHYGPVPNVPTHNVFLTAIGSDGVELWRKTYGGAEHDGSEDIAVSDDSYGIVARSNSRPGTAEDVYFVQVNPDGSVRDEQWFGTDADDAGYGIFADEEGFIISGYSRGGPYGGKDVYVRAVR